MIVKRIRVLVCVMGALSLSAARIDAQTTRSTVATGAPGSTTVDDVRKTYQLHPGPFYISPKLLLKELGFDSNVYNTVQAQEEDFTFTLTPQADIALPVARRALFLVNAGADLLYFQKNASQRAVNPAFAGRAELYLRRLTLFARGEYENTRERANYEIDLRLRHLDTSASGGVVLRLSSKTSLEGDVHRTGVEYERSAAAIISGLKQALDRHSEGYDAALRHRFTPLTSMFVKYESFDDHFPLEPERDAKSYRIMPGVEFKPKALISGRASVGYRSFTPSNPLVPPFSGPVADVSLSYTLLSSTTFGVTAGRDIAYSFEADTPYFVADSVGLSIRRALSSRFDVTLTGTRNRYTYRPPMIVPPNQVEEFGDEITRVDTTDNYTAGLGYWIRRQTRIGVGGSYWTRRSNVDPIFRSHAYDRLRVGLTVDYGF